MRFMQVWLICGGIAVSIAASLATGQEWKPQKNVDLVVSAGAGGAADRQARLKQDPGSVTLAFAKIVQDEDWKKDLERNSWADDFRGSAETRKHLDSEYDLLAKALVELGVISR